MVLENLVPVLSNLSESIWGRTLDGFDLGNGLFGSIVAVTGDAHQAQVAQDIFRQEVRIERSVRIREDIRDAHKLMIENVQTQLLMGSIILGICFTLLIEGRPSDPERAPTVVQELWAVFAVWSISLSFLSVWFALQFQEVVSVSARRRLLDKHRVFTPNDDVVGRMGGLSLAEKVAHLHQRGLNELALFLANSTGTEGALESLANAAKALAKGNTPATRDADGVHALEREVPEVPKEREAVSTKHSCMTGLSSRTGMETAPPHLDVGVYTKQRWQQPAVPSRWERPTTRSGAPVTVRLSRGIRAWFDDEQQLLDTHIVDLPDFLLDETLVRWSWSMPSPMDKPRWTSMRLRVRGDATLYVAAQWPKQSSGEAFRGQGPPPNWDETDMPKLEYSGNCFSFQRVEGFSILVSEGKMDLPIYRAQLNRPDSSGWCSVKLKFQFPDSFIAPIVILRRGAIPSGICEEDWPVREFMNELGDIQPLREHSMHYMSHGLLNLLLAAFFAHLGRVLTDRPWPQCQREVGIILCALLPALIYSSSPDRMMRYMLNMHVPRHSITGSRDAAGEGAGEGSGEEAMPVRPRPEPLGLPSSAPSEQSLSHCASGEGSPGPADMLETPMSCTSPKLESRSILDGDSSGGESVDFMCCMPKRGPVREPPGESSPVRRQLFQGGDGDCHNDNGIGTLDRQASPDSEAGQPVVAEVPEPAFPSEMTDSAAMGSRSLRRMLTTSSGASPRLSVTSAASSERSQRSVRRWPLGQLSRLEAFKLGVKLLRVFSIAWILLSWFLRDVWGKGRLGQAGGSESNSLSTTANIWTVHSVAWPSPFFTPTVAALAPDGLLWLASDWSLVALSDGGAGSLVGLPLRLPAAAKGLLVPSNGTGKLLVAGEDLLHGIDVLNASLNASSAGRHFRAPAGLRGLATAQAAPPKVGAPLELPMQQLGPIVAAAAAALPAAGGRSRDVVALAPAAGGLFLCAGTI